MKVTIKGQGHNERSKVKAGACWDDPRPLTDSTALVMAGLA